MIRHFSREDEGSAMSSRQRAAMASRVVRHPPMSSWGETGGRGGERGGGGGEGRGGGAPPADVELGRDGAREEEGAGLKLVVHRANEAAKLGDRIGELQLVQKPRGMAGQDAVVSAGDG